MSLVNGLTKSGYVLGDNDVIVLILSISSEMIDYYLVLYEISE